MDVLFSTSSGFVSRDAEKRLLTRMFLQGDAMRDFYTAAVISVTFLIAGCPPNSDSGNTTPEVPEVPDQEMPPLVGGYSKAATTDPEVAEMAEFAVAESAKETPGLTLLSITSAETQVVAGMNYRLTLSVKDSDKTRTAEAVVYRDLQQKKSLTSWTWK
jgi:hypothetical protein